MKRIIKQSPIEGSNIDAMAVYNQSIDVKSSKVIIVPTWTIYLSSLFISFLFVVLIAAYVILICAPRPGLYLESCFQRSCSKPNNLKCLDGICQCKPNEYYTNKCISKKNLFEKCQRDNQCFTDYCNAGQCKCSNKTSVCKSHNQNCASNSDCIENKMLTCINSKCQCDNSRFWDGDVCVRKRVMYERCSTYEYCDSSLNLACSNNTCRCIFNSHYENPYKKLCEPRTGYYSNCSNSTTCFSNLTCTFGLCTCPGYQAYRNDIKKCANCPSETYGFDDRCYSYRGNETWFFARDYCQALGGWLATPQNIRTITVIRYSLPFDNIWLGYNRENFACLTNVWISQSPYGINLQHFCSNPPSCTAKTEFCVNIQVGTGFCLTARPCNDAIYFFCEFMPN